MFNLYDEYYLKDRGISIGLLTIYSALANKHFEDLEIDLLEPLDSIYILKRLQRNANNYITINNFIK